MKTLISTLMGVLLLTGCLGNRARDNVLMPNVVQAWAGVLDNLDTGIADGIDSGLITVEQANVLNQEISELDAAIAQEDRGALVGVDWNTLKPWALRGVQVWVDEQVIGTGVAMSLIERIELFSDALEELRGGSLFVSADGGGCGGRRAA